MLIFARLFDEFLFRDCYKVLKNSFAHKKLNALFEDTVVRHALELDILPSNQPSTSSATSEPKRRRTQLLEDDFFAYEAHQHATPTGTTLEDRVRKECKDFIQSLREDVSMLESYPFVKAVFIKFNTPLPSSAPVERIFNFGGMILQPKRKRITDANFERSMLLKLN